MVEGYPLEIMSAGGQIYDFRAAICLKTSKSVIGYRILLKGAERRNEQDLLELDETLLNAPGRACISFCDFTSPQSDGKQ